MPPTHTCTHVLSYLFINFVTHVLHVTSIVLRYFLECASFSSYMYVPSDVRLSVL
ncbi:hypothetical protein DM02DRAFT_620426 [Periconia macrospinosa]|uniref:Uncharacterized protein n=1 Tax=Periconia macrospinosa TaxID=97972 RepID=A0A2V1D294_9PLEO|nr:hypothetical protein DM02DRAFT_620426 [Periconia macrospinosa]